MHKHKHTRRQKGEGTCDQRQEDRSAGQKRHGAVHAPLVLDDVDASVVDSVVALVALVVIVAIFDCRCAEHNQEREPGGDGTEVRLMSLTEYDPNARTELRAKKSLYYLIAPQYQKNII